MLLFFFILSYWLIVETSSSNQVKEQGDDTKPLWNYVSKIKGLSGGGGNFEVRCNFYEIVFNGSYTRVRTHLLKITGKGVRSYQKITPSRLAQLPRWIMRLH